MNRLLNNVVIIIVSIISLLTDNAFSGCFNNGFVSFAK